MRSGGRSVHHGGDVERIPERFPDAYGAEVVQDKIMRIVIAIGIARGITRVGEQRGGGEDAPVDAGDV